MEISIFEGMPLSLNIVSFDVPYPPNYGGVIDVYHKLRWLKKSGVDIYLHCFQYGRPEAPELKELCKEVNYYPRRTGISSAFSNLPYTVKSRRSKELERKLLSNDFPILFEVLHTCYLMKDPRFKNRIKIYRHSNIEHEYYRQLAESENSTFKRFYLRNEASRLEKFESVLHHANHILAVNRKDAEYFERKYPQAKTQFLPSFHENDAVEIKEGKGDFILYHGNLSISENYESATWLIDHVFSAITHKVIIAGMNPPDFLRSKVRQHSNIQLIENPSFGKMNELINNAQVHCLYTPQATGLKLKLLNVLFKGRFIICNDHMVSGTGIQQNSGLLISNNMTEKIEQCFAQQFNEAFINERRSLLENFSNSNNVKRLLAIIQ